MDHCGTLEIDVRSARELAEAGVEVVAEAAGAAEALAALAGNDINLVLDTTCRVRVAEVPNGAGGTATNVCDPTGGFDFTPQTKDNFGKINLKRGHRVIELVLKYYF